MLNRVLLSLNRRSNLGIGEMDMAENEMREPYEQPELTKLGSLRELTAEQCWECQGSVPFDPFA